MKPRKRKIEVVPYDPEWPVLFAQEAEAIRAIAPDCFVAIHHIGSTAVPGLAAKPVIDIMPIVTDLGLLDQINSGMEDLGYIVKGEFGIPGRRFFLKGLIDRTHHVHAFEEGSGGLMRHVAFRDYLRCHPDEAEKYAELKMKNAAQFPHDNDGYCDAKHDFVTELEKRAVAWMRH